MENFFEGNFDAKISLKLIIFFLHISLVRCMIYTSTVQKGRGCICGIRRIRMLKMILKIFLGR